MIVVIIVVMIIMSIEKNICNYVDATMLYAHSVNTRGWEGLIHLKFRVKIDFEWNNE